MLQDYLGGDTTVSQHGHAMLNIAILRLMGLNLGPLAFHKNIILLKLFHKNSFSVKRKEYADRNQLCSVEKQINGHGHTDHHDQQMKEDTSVIEHE